MLKTMIMYPTSKKDLRKKDNGRKSMRSLKKPCPFIQEPYDNSFCANMLSQSIESAMYYCGSHFSECAVYQRWS